MQELWKAVREYWLLCRLLRGGDRAGRELAMAGIKAKIPVAPRQLQPYYMKLLK